MDLLNGYYTSVLPNGGHITFNVGIGKKFSLKGKRIVSYMVGNSNVGEYKPFAFVNGNFINVWKKFKAEQPAELVVRIEAGLKVLKGDSFGAGKTYALKSGNCFICHRKLTNPESIEDGIGPECRKRVGR